ncbi:MAG: hypothetical protein WD739_06975 [Actinomycetota bacterium]
MKRLLIAPVLTVLVMVPSTASAHYLSHLDGNDTRKKLDIRKVSLRFHRDTHRIVLTVRTYGRFQLKRDGYIYGDLDAHGDQHRDYNFKIWNDPGGAREICDFSPRHPGNRLVRRPPIDFHVGRRIARCSIKAGNVRRTGHMRWRVRTTRFDRFVIDRAPDGGAWYEH